LRNFQVTIPGNCSISRYCQLEVALKNIIFVNISAKTKIFSKIFKVVNLGSRHYGFMKKTRLQKSHATVPLTNARLIMKVLEVIFYAGQTYNGPF